MEEIKYIKLVEYKYHHYNISLPTHYNKHDILINSYKYDISSHALNFIIFKIKNNELKFIINDKFSEEDFLRYIYQVKDHKEAKEIYTKLSGLIVRESREYYDELIRSSVYTMERLLELNMKIGLDFKVLKVFVDEFVVDKPLLIKNIKNDFLYNFNESRFYLFIKKLDSLNKQMYITDNGIDIKHTFSREHNLITDLSKIWIMGCNYTDINNFTSDIINKRYDNEKLFQFDEKGNEFLYSDGVKIQTKFIDSSTIYDPNYYYNIYQDIASKLILAKQYI